ncbi:MAG: DUF1194 domain-containing protein [Rhodospirillales bacterium]|nr:DUF1194 domain-containing protein [Rhodospirillales bacterium]
MGTAGRLLARLGIVLLAWLPGPAPGQSGRPVDLELVLAVDTSSSVSAEEFDLQMRGLAEAFRSPAVVQAIQAAGDLGVAVALVQWSDNRKQTLAIDWTMVTGEASARGFAEEIENTPRFLIGGGTALGGALAFSMRQFETSGYQGRRKVIDVSGDGRTNQGAHPSKIRDLAVAAGITVNGLAILNEDLYVDRYYLYNVIGGTGAFVMTADDYQDFARAILQKLIKEIAGVPIAGRPAPAATG